MDATNSEYPEALKGSSKMGKKLIIQKKTLTTQTNAAG